MGTVFFLTDLPSVPVMDIMLAISSTSRRADVNFRAIKEVLVKLIESYGVQRVRYSTLAFGKEPLIQVRFTQSLSEEALKRNILLIPRLSGSSLEAALLKAKDVFDESSRPDTKKVLVIITDKKSESEIDDVKAAAVKVEQADIVVIPVAFGNLADPDEAVVTTPNKENVVETKDTSDPNDIAEEISSKVLVGELIERGEEKNENKGKISVLSL